MGEDGAEVAHEALRDADPRQVGAYRIQERRVHRPEGVVYAARGATGEPVSVAVLSSGAASDPAVLDRFRAAVVDGAGLAERPRVLASTLSGPVVWVAVAASRPDAANVFLDAVAAPEPRRGSGPTYVPYWASAAAPATARWPWPTRLRALRGVGADPGSNPGLVAGVVALIALLAALLLVLYFLMASMSREVYAPPPEAPPSPAPEVSPSPVQPSPRGSPSPAVSPSVEPSPRDSSSPGPSPSPVPSVSLEPEEDHPFPIGPARPEDLL